MRDCRKWLEVVYPGRSRKHCTLSFFPMIIIVLFLKDSPLLLISLQHTSGGGLLVKVVEVSGNEWSMHSGWDMCTHIQDFLSILIGLGILRISPSDICVRSAKSMTGRGIASHLRARLISSS